MAVAGATTGAAPRGSAAGAWLSVALAAVALVACVVGLVLGLTPSPDNALPLLGSAGTFVLGILFAAIGLILRQRRPDHLLGWILLLFGVTVGLSTVIWGIVYVAALPGGDAVLGQRVAWLGEIITFPVWAFLGASLVIRFPSGRPESRADARLLRFSIVIGFVDAVLAAVRPGQFYMYTAFGNPLHLGPPLEDLVTFASTLALLAAVVPISWGTLNMLGRYRRGSAVEQAQLRWFAFAGLLAFAGGLLFVLVGVVAAPSEVVRQLTYAVMILGFCALPIAILEAITRHRLYDIDTIIGRTFAYGALTAILAGLYAASLKLFSTLFVLVTGQGSDAALVLTTLVLTTTFTPIKGRLERFAARRLNPKATPVEPAPADDPQLEAMVRRMVDEALRDAAAR